MFITRFRGLGRIVRVLALVLFVAAMAPLPGYAAANGTPDYSAALLMPSDLEELGWEDYGVDSGRMMTLPQMLRDTGNPDWDDPDFLATRIEWVHSLILHPIGGLDENDGADINIVNMIFTYEDDEAADEGFDFFEDESDDPTATDLEDAPELGDDTEMTEYVDTWVENGVTYELHAIDISIRIGNAVAIVALNGFDEEVDRDDVETIGEFLAEKLEAVIEDGEVDGEPTPGLDTMVPRYGDDAVMVTRSHYCSFGGEVVVHAYDPAADEITQERIDEYDLEASYCGIQKLPLAEDDGDYLILQVEPMKFARKSGAVDYIQATIVDDLAEDPDFEVEELDVEELPFEADEAWMVTYEHDAGGLETVVTEVVVRDGKFVFELRMNGLEAPHLDTLVTLLADVADCYEDACTALLELPDAVTEFLADQIELYEEM